MDERGYARAKYEAQAVTEPISADTRRLLLLNDIARAATQTLNPEEMAEAIYRELSAFLEVDAFYLAAYYSQSQELDMIMRIDQGIRVPRARRKLTPSLSKLVVESARPLLIGDLEEEKDHYPFIIWGTGKIPRSYLGVPMLVESQVVGIMSIQSYRPHAYSEKEVELLSVIASQVALMLRNALTHEQAEKRAKNLAIVNQIAQRITIALEPATLYSETVKAIQKEFNYYGVSLYLVEGEYAVLKAAAGEYARFIKGEYRQRITQGIIGWAISNGETVISNDVEQDPRYVLGPVPVGIVRSELCVPVKFQGRVIGALDVQSREVSAFTLEDARTLEAIAAQLAVALHNANLYRTLKEERELLRSFTEALPDQFVVIEPDFIVSVVNEGVLRSLGLSREEVIGQPCYRLYYGLDAPCTETPEHPCLVRRVFKEGCTARAIIKADGKVYEDFACPVRDDKGRVVRVIYGRRDITAERLLQEKLNAVHRLGQRLITTTDENAIIEAVLDTAEQVLKYRAISYLEVDEIKNELRLRAVRGIPEADRPFSLSLEGDKGLTVAAVRSGQPLYTPDVTKDPRYVPGTWGISTRSELDVPVIVKGKVVGVINVEDERVNAFTDDDVRLLSTLANWMGLALENAQLIKELSQRAMELETLWKASTALTGTLDLDSLLAEILSAAINIIPGAEKGSILLLDEQTGELTIRSLKGYTDPRIKEIRFPVSEGYSAKAMREGKALLIRDARADPEIRYDGEIEEIRAIKSAVVAPLRVKDRIIGVISLDSEKPAAFNEDDLRMLSALASQAAIAIENARLFQAEQEQRHLTEALAEAIAAISGTLSLDEVLDRILEQVEKVVPGDAFNVAVMEDSFVKVVRWRGYERFGVEERIADLTLSADQYHSLKTMAETGEPYLVTDTETDPYWKRWKGWEWLRSYVGAPIRFRNRILGFLSVDGTRPGQFTEDDAHRLEAFAAAAATAIRNARLAEALALSEARYRLLTESNLAGVYLIQEGKFRYVNPALAAIFGYKPEEIVNKLGPIDLTAPEDRPLVAENIRKRIEGEVESIRYRFRGLRKDGSVIYCEALGVRTYYQGQPAILGTLLDVTEQVRAEEQARRRIRELEILNRLADALIGTLDVEEMAAQAARLIRELTEADAIGLHFLAQPGLADFVVSTATGMKAVSVALTDEDLERLRHLPDSPTFAQDISPLLACMGPAMKEKALGRGFSSGAILPIRSQGFGFVGIFYRGPHTWTEEEKRLLGAVIRQLNLAFDKAFLHREVKRAREEWEATFNSITDGLYIVDREFNLLRVNEALADKLGLSPQELIDRKCYEVIHGTDSPPPWCPRLEVFKVKKPFSTEVEEPHLGGTFVFHVYPVLDEEGNVVSSSHLIRDVTKEREMQERLFQAEKLASLGQLVSGIAHELNNPLTSVVGYAQLVSQDPSLPERLKQDLARICEQAQRAANIVQNMLDFARKRPPRREPVDINTLLRKTLELRSYEMRVGNIKLITDLAPDLPMTEADPQQLQQVFINIIVNAEQAMIEAHDGGTLRVKSYLTPENYIRIEFTDDGPGIPEEHLSRIFDPFFTTKEKGTGMGLAIAYSLVAEHKGRIWARNNRLGPGVTFYVEIPVVKPKEEISWAEELLKTLEKKEAPPPARILVVDDERPIVELLARVLAQEGYDTTTVTSGEQALKLLETEEFDLIIADVKMPGVSGKALYRKMKEQRPELARRFLFVTGDVMEAETQSFLAASGQPFLTKPFNLQRVKEVVRDSLEELRKSAPE